MHAHLKFGAQLSLLASKAELFFGSLSLLLGRAAVFFPFFSVLEDLVYGNTDGHQPGKCGYPREDSVQRLLAHFPILQSKDLVRLNLIERKRQVTESEDRRIADEQQMIPAARVLAALTRISITKGPAILSRVCV